MGDIFRSVVRECLFGKTFWGHFCGKLSVNPIHAKFDGYSHVDLLDNVALVCFTIADWGLK